MWLEISLGLLIVALIFYSFLKPLPAGTGVRTKKHRVSESAVSFFYDLTWLEKGKRRSEMGIFNEVVRMLAAAKTFFVMDMFLFNTNQANANKHRRVTRDLCELLIEKKKRNKDFIIHLILDPLNTFYGSYEPEIYRQLKKAGITIIHTDLEQLRDRNYLYSAVWRLVFKQIERISFEPNWIKDPSSRKKRFVSVRSILTALNARANHRKVVITDDGDDVRAMVSSANLHEASSWFTNAAFTVCGAPAFEVLQTEEAVARFSGSEMEVFTGFKFEKNGDVQVQVLTEDKIEKPLVEDIRAAQAGATISIHVLFIADFDILFALLGAAKRGAAVRLVLDRNLHSFEQKKNGLPNQVSGWFLHDVSRSKVQVRWWANSVDQLHSKMMVIEQAREMIVYNGSANYTVRNVGGYSLESNLRLVIAKDSKLAQKIRTFNDRLFESPFSVPISECPKSKGHVLKVLVFMLQKITGFTTF